jgi:DNA ligase-1
MQPNSYKQNGKRICNPVGWYMSEKLDGMKGKWINGELRTRNENILKPPKWFKKLLPTEYNLEGELYFGKNSFHKTGSLRSHDPLSWDKVEFHIFELIDYNLNWLDRKRKLKEIINVNDKIRIVKWKKILDCNHVEEKLKSIIEKNGEGLILADPNGMYVDGYVDHILKYKQKKDREAIVVGYKTDEECKRLTSLIVKDRKIIFNIGTGLKIKHRYNFEERFPIGSIISYWYEIIGKNGKPRTPIFKGVRIDV